MKFALKVLVIIVIAILLVSSVYVIFFTGEENNGGVDDNEAPTIDTVTGDTTAKAGKTITISATFSDNVNVTIATLYYKKASADSWSNASILSGSADISVPSSPVEDWYYYVTIDDAAGNGPVGDPSTNGSVYYTITVSEDNGNGNHDNHYVFIEEGTFTTCEYCPNVATILDELYKSGDYRFYYVSMVEDKSDKAKERLESDYNIFAYPTVFIDGGYKVIMGGNKEKSVYAQAIRDAESRDVPEIKITANTEYDNNTDEMLTELLVENNEKETYDGRLRVYLTEIVSRWNGNDGKPYHYAFLEYIINEDISIGADGSESFSKTLDISDYDHENLMIIAVVFNSDSIEKYANPDSNENPFDAYYADAVDAVEVVPGGNLPPEVGIILPQEGKIYLNGKPFLERLSQRKILGSVFNLLVQNTMMYGQKTFIVYAKDDSAIEKIEFYIDGELVYTIEEEPYEWTFKKLPSSFIRSILMKKHTLEVIAYDGEGKTSSASIEFKARI